MSFREFLVRTSVQVIENMLPFFFPHDLFLMNIKGSNSLVQEVFEISTEARVRPEVFSSDECG